MDGDRRLHGYRVLLAPALTEVRGITDDPADLEAAERILAATESADGRGLTRSEIAERAGFAPDDERFRRRFALLVRAGALHPLRGTKKHQIRYRPEPEALLAAELLARISAVGGAQELHSLLVAAADQLELAFRPDPEQPPPDVEDVAALISKLAAYLHAYAQRMEAAAAVGTLAEMTAARIGSGANRQMEQVERISRAINRSDSPYRRLFGLANRLLAAGQRLVASSQQLTERLVEITSTGEHGGVLSLLSPEQCLNAAIHRSPEQLFQVAATIPFTTTSPLVTLADLQDAAADIDRPQPPRQVPTPPSGDDSDNKALDRLLQRQRATQAHLDARRRWAERTLGEAGETDLTEHATSWPHAAKLLADVMAISRDPTTPMAADVGDPPLVEPDAEVVVRHPLRLRRLAGTQISRPDAGGDADAQPADGIVLGAEVRR